MTALKTLVPAALLIALGGSGCDFHLGTSGGARGGSGGMAFEEAGGASGGGGGGGGGKRDAGSGKFRDAATDLMPPGEGCGFAKIVSKTVFDSLFVAMKDRAAVYTYEGLVKAIEAFPDFANTGSSDTCRAEAAAFLAHVWHETGGLKHAEENSKQAYCDTRANCPCEATATDPARWYYGRGAIQLSWNYNYCSAGQALGADLLAQPNLVASDPILIWKTALWFWMDRKGAGTMTSHAAMTATAPGQPGGFGETIRTINGARNCGMGGYGVLAGLTARVDLFIQFARRLGLANPGAPTDLDC